MIGWLDDSMTRHMSSERVEPFKDHVAVHDYAKANGLEYVWEYTRAFEKRRRPQATT
jgi:hypothetical protein